MPNPIYRRVRLAPTLCAAFWLLASASPVAAQRRAVFRGQVFDSAGTQLGNVQVTLAEANRTARTDSNGMFAFRELAPGFYHVTLREPGFHPITGTARVAAADSIDLKFWMKSAQVQLDTVHVSDAGPGDPLADFKRRMAYGVGTFITSETLDRLQDWHLSSLIRSQAGRVQLAPLPAGGWTLVSQIPSACLDRSCPAVPLCYMAVWVDGIRVFAPGMGQPPPDLSRYRVADLVGVEVYAGAAETPLELNATGSSCGTIVLWTRMGRAGTGRN